MVDGLRYRGLTELQPDKQCNTLTSLSRLRAAHNLTEAHLGGEADSQSWMVFKGEIKRTPTSLWEYEGFAPLGFCG